MVKQKVNMANQLLGVPAVVGGKNGNYIYIGGLLICWGIDNAANAGTTINFAKTFSATPAVICTIQDPNNQTAWASSITTSSVVLKQLYTASALTVSWMAIGPA